MNCGTTRLLRSNSQADCESSGVGGGVFGPPIPPKARMSDTLNADIECQATVGPCEVDEFDCVLKICHGTDELSNEEDKESESRSLLVGALE